MVTKQAVGDIQQLLNHKQNEMRMNQSSGRLMKNPIIPLVEGSHKLFVKEHSESKEINAVFTLIIDQSFSMEPHMENAIGGVIVFNHILKSLNIRHRIISHHEDTFEVIPNNFPNRIYEHMSFDKSIYYHPVSILDIETSGDNRDGFILKHEISLLKARSEADKFVIMFSDGLPSAEDYNQSGIVDTHEAVNIARRENINVINVFISEESDEQTIESIKNIYGINTIIVSHAYEIPQAVAGTLRKILLRLLN
jgi:nitric oxide reductase activation protein